MDKTVSATGEQRDVDQSERQITADDKQDQPETRHHEALQEDSDSERTRTGCTDEDKHKDDILQGNTGGCKGRSKEDISSATDEEVAVKQDDSVKYKKLSKPEKLEHSASKRNVTIRRHRNLSMDDHLRYKFRKMSGTDDKDNSRKHDSAGDVSKSLELERDGSKFLGVHSTDEKHRHRQKHHSGSSWSKEHIKDLVRCHNLGIAGSKIYDTGARLTRSFNDIKALQQSKAGYKRISDDNSSTKNQSEYIGSLSNLQSFGSQASHLMRSFRRSIRRASTRSSPGASQHSSDSLDTSDSVDDAQRASRHSLRVPTSSLPGLPEVREEHVTPNIVIETPSDVKYLKKTLQHLKQAEPDEYLPGKPHRELLYELRRELDRLAGPPTSDREKLIPASPDHESVAEKVSACSQEYFPEFPEPPPSKPITTEPKRNPQSPFDPHPGPSREPDVSREFRPRENSNYACLCCPWGQGDKSSDFRLCCLDIHCKY